MNTILLGNLIMIRWIAIFGQIFAIFFVTFIIKIDIPADKKTGKNDAAFSGVIKFLRVNVVLTIL